MARKYLFIAIPNNSGSTMLFRYLARCKKVASQSTEGQEIYGTKNGPVNMEGGNKGVYFPESSDFSNMACYNWSEIKCAWEHDWQKTNKNKIEDCTVFLEKSPPNVARAMFLQEQFENSYFITSIRNPYAFCEGMKRRVKFSVERAANGWVKIAEMQINNIKSLKNNVFFTYTELCENKNNVREKIVKMLPELDDLNLEDKINAHSIKSVGFDLEPVENFNDEQIKNLSNEEIEKISKILKENVEKVERFGYNIL